jgi:hypothetical protein
MKTAEYVEDAEYCQHNSVCPRSLRRNETERAGNIRPRSGERMQPTAQAVGIEMLITSPGGAKQKFSYV